MENKPRLWTSSFTRITVATILSAIGGEVISLPVSLLVFDNTRSTLLSAVIIICGYLPDVLLSVLIAPVIDRTSKRRWLVGLDSLLLALYLLAAFLSSAFGFQYVMYVVFTLAVGVISVVYRLAYQAWYPSLIPLGAEQQGYAVSNSLYPAMIIIFAPVAAFLYQHLSISRIFLIVSALLGVSIFIERSIPESAPAPCASGGIKGYLADLKGGLAFIRKEKGIRNIYSYIAITNGAGEGVGLMAQAFFQTAPGLSVTMLGLLKSAEMIGRVLSGVWQYKTTIPAKKRYPFTVFVYLAYLLMDLILLFTPYAAMAVNRFIVGGLGQISGTIRHTAVQSYLPDEYRARVNAFFNMWMSLGSVAFHLLAGWMGQAFGYRAGCVMLTLMQVAACTLLIILPRRQNRPVYEAKRRGA